MSADERIIVPGSKSPRGAAREEVDLARILKALQTIEGNSADRARDLRLLLFFLPLIWGIVWGFVFWFVYLLASGK